MPPAKRTSKSSKNTQVTQITQITPSSPREEVSEVADQSTDSVPVENNDAEKQEDNTPPQTHATDQEQDSFNYPLDDPNEDENTYSDNEGEYRDEQRGEQSHTEPRKIHIRPTDHTMVDEILAACNSCGTVESHWFSQPPRYFAFVTMSTSEEAHAVIQKYNNQRFGPRHTTVGFGLSRDNPDQDFDQKRELYNSKQTRRHQREDKPRHGTGRSSRQPLSPYGVPPYHGYPPHARGARHHYNDVAPYPPYSNYPPPHGWHPGPPPPPHRRSPHSHDGPSHEEYEHRSMPPRHGPHGHDNAHYPPQHYPFPRGYSRHMQPPPHGGPHHPPHHSNPRRVRDNNAPAAVAGPNTRCYHCNGIGHISVNCPNPKFDVSSCFTCHQEGHLQRDCPQRKNR